MVSPQSQLQASCCNSEPCQAGERRVRPAPGPPPPRAAPTWVGDFQQPLCARQLRLGRLQLPLQRSQLRGARARCRFA
jgi:hypothetical protein